MTIRGQEFFLLPEKALWWRDGKALLLSDLHLGKSRHFRRKGIPVPSGDTEETLGQLQRAIQKTGVERVFLLGDLFHSSWNSDWNFMSRMNENYSDLEFVLIVGNHDILPTELYAKTGIKTTLQWELSSEILLTHEPGTGTGDPHYRISGHLHPGITIRGKGRQFLRVPCYWFAENQAVLPAFGSFTGLQTIRPGSSDKVYAIFEGGVYPVNSKDKTQGAFD